MKTVTSLSPHPAEENVGVVLRSDNAAVAVLCRPSGILLEVVYDELGLQHSLTPGREFSSVIAPFHRRKAHRFLRTMRAGGSALDWELGLSLSHGIVPLFFSGCITNRGIVIIGAKEPLTAGTIPGGLAKTEKHADSMAPAIQELRVRKEEKAKVERRLEQQLLRLSEALSASAKGVKERRPERPRGSQHLRLLEIAAHDLRNPISGVLAATEYLIEDAGRVLEPHHLALLYSIESSAQLMLRLLQDMVEIPTMSPRKVRLELHSTDLPLLIEHAVASNASVAESKRVKIEVRMGKPLPALMADAGKLTAAVEGLLYSAIRSSQPATVIGLEVTADPEQVILTLRHHPSSDSADLIKSLFHPTLNARPRRGLSDQRAELALAHMRRVVAAHHGTVEYQSGRGPESVVTLALPLSARVKSRTRTEPQRRKGGGAAGH